jgi:hypothetical protein
MSLGIASRQKIQPQEAVFQEAASLIPKAKHSNYLHMVTERNLYIMENLYASNLQAIGC